MMVESIDDASWKTLEDHVRLIASLKWDCPARAEVVNGVRCDAVLKKRQDYWIVIEISRESSLPKLRTDLAKFASIKGHLFSQGVFIECFFCCLKPSESLIETGKGQKVEVLTPSDLERSFFDYSSYHHRRSKQRFGSAVDPNSGNSDPRPYVEVEYLERDSPRTYKLEILLRWLLDGRKIILLGGFGSGKSRCAMELFVKAKQDALERYKYPIAIDLRENWGLKRKGEIVRRHLSDLGLSHLGDPLLKILDTGSVSLVLDGFDEIATQSWSDDPKRLAVMRSQALVGVKSLIQEHRGGILITGREHYFNSDEEMFRSLGLCREETLVVRCADEFSPEQVQQYLGTRLATEFPEFLPKRPIVLQLLVDLADDELEGALDEKISETRFWKLFLDAICRREARIHPTLEWTTIRSVLLEIAQVSRDKPNNVGPLTLSEINAAFEKVVGNPPRDEASTMLQRLPTLGRVDSETSDRRFLDPYTLDGLRGTALVEAVGTGQWKLILAEKWVNPLSELGRSLLAESIQVPGAAAIYFTVLKEAAYSPNKTLAGDMLSGLLASGLGGIDYKGITLSDAYLGTVDLAEVEVENLTISDCLIDELRIGPETPRKVSVSTCIVRVLRGVSAKEHIPEWIADCVVEEIALLTNLAKIKHANLTPEQEILVSFIHKIFFQPGGGRKEQALLRGLGESGSQKSAKRILGSLLDEKIIETFPGKEGLVYVPVRKHKRRLGRLLSELDLSDDPLWISLRNS